MKRYGLLGRTLKHSFSAVYFAEKFRALGITDAVYENFEISSMEKLPELLAGHPDLQGLNVTIPYKEDVLSFLTQKSGVVEAIGACNTVKIDGQELIGHNTDVVGFREALEPKLGPQHNKALVLGTGGASKAVCYVLSQLGIEYALVSRSKTDNHLGYEDLGEAVLSSHLLLINTTPLGTYPNVTEAPPVPYRFISPQHFLFDLVYNPAKTKFLAEGEKQGAQISNGYQMLVEQAEESWRIWNG